jgi:hypothetical protein
VYLTWCRHIYLAVQLTPCRLGQPNDVRVMRRGVRARERNSRRNRTSSEERTRLARNWFPGMILHVWEDVERVRRGNEHGGAFRYVVLQRRPWGGGGVINRYSLCSQQYFSLVTTLYKVVQIWPGQTVTCLHTNNPGHIWTTLYFNLF